MNTTFFILFIVADVIFLALVVWWLLRYQNKKIRSRNLSEFQDYAVKHELRFDKIQSLNKNIIGLDREKMKLVFLDKSGEQTVIHNIDLTSISQCRLVKLKKDPNSSIRKIVLEIILNEPSPERILLPFYDERKDKFQKMMRLAKKALYWKKTINLFKELPAVAVS